MQDSIVNGGLFHVHRFKRQLRINTFITSDMHYSGEMSFDPLLVALATLVPLA